MNAGGVDKACKSNELGLGSRKVSSNTSDSMEKISG